MLLGEAGLGKTALLDYAARHAGGAAGCCAQRGSSPEADLPFAGLHRLLLPVLDSIEALPPSQAAAMSAALGLGPVTASAFWSGPGCSPSWPRWP